MTNKKLNTINIGVWALSPLRNMPTTPTTPTIVINIVDDYQLDNVNTPYIWVSPDYTLLFNIEDYFGIVEEEFDYDNRYSLGDVSEQGVISKVNLILLNTSGVILL